MQRILTEEEYQELKDKADKFDDIREYICKSIYINTNSRNVYGKHNAIIGSFTSSITATLNIDVKKLFELLEIKLPDNYNID